MIAVYYADCSSPYTMWTIEVESTDEAHLLAEIERQEYATPAADIVFIDNGKVVAQYYIGENDE